MSRASAHLRVADLFGKQSWMALIAVRRSTVFDSMPGGRQALTLATRGADLPQRRPILSLAEPPKASSEKPLLMQERFQHALTLTQVARVIGSRFAVRENNRLTAHVNVPDCTRTEPPSCACMFSMAVEQRT